MPILDFKEISQANKANGQQDTFELFARDFFELLGYAIIQGPDRGPDNGRDIIIEETRTGPGGTTSVRWLVSCKHYAHSGNSVGVNDEQNILDRVNSNGCRGFIGFYSTLPSAGLATMIERLDIAQVQIFDREKIEAVLLKPNDDDFRNLSLRYFALSAGKWRGIRALANQVEADYVVLLPDEELKSYDVEKQDAIRDSLASLCGVTRERVAVLGLESGSVRMSVRAPMLLSALMSMPRVQQRLRGLGVRSWSVKLAPFEFPEDYVHETDGSSVSYSQTQSEAQLEDSLLQRLTGLGHERVVIANEDEFVANLRKQLEKFNQYKFSDEEFAKVLNHLDRGNEFQRAETLRGRFPLQRADKPTKYIRFLNTDHWCRNEYQVTHQVPMEGTYSNRYDVTLLVNGLPLVQIELKRRGLELKEAFNQINRYHRHSFWATRGLYRYVQIFVISNGVNTKYYANNRNQSFKQTFYWARENNDPVKQLDQFADLFLEKCQFSKMICKYIVLQQSDKIMMVLRPYQYYAVENMVRHVKTSTRNGYIWHTTGSGKTLTSFKASQIIQDLPEVDKVLFVVDRADLDYQTTREFNHFLPDCVDETNNTRSLVEQLNGETKLIVTTIQKLNNAIRPGGRFLSELDGLADKRVIFIFDECHRSQFGQTHKRITDFFKNYQMFGFTGTPIFADNASKNELGKRTTKDLFEKRLHRYVITDAIRDQNVLKFSVEYWGRLKTKDGSLIDEKVSGINTREFFEDDDRIEKTVNWIVDNHNRKTHDRMFSAILAVGSVTALIKYYDLFKQKQDDGKHSLRFATIFSSQQNEEDEDADGLIADPSFDIGVDAPVNKHTRERLDEFIGDYNTMYGTAHSTRDRGFYTYYQDLGQRIKDRERKDFNDDNRLDILLVVNMFLTGFDAKKINTLYVDKNLNHHGLIQAYSRTNRILGSRKSQGNIVCFRNLKKSTDKAIELFSNPNANEEIFVEPYEDYVSAFNEGVKKLKEVTPTVSSVDKLQDEEEVLEFVKAFRTLIRTMNVLTTFSQFEFGDLNMAAQQFNDYRSKYLDIHDRSGGDSDQPVSIVNDIDFELELIHRDEINVAYILRLLTEMHEAESSDETEQSAENKKKSILDLLGTEAQLRSKRKLIEQFIDQNMPQIGSDEDVAVAFRRFWDRSKQEALEGLCAEEDLTIDRVLKVIERHHFTNLRPMRDDIVATLKTKPKIRERKTVIERVTEKILDLVRTFDDDMGDI